MNKSNTKPKNLSCTKQQEIFGCMYVMFYSCQSILLFFLLRITATATRRFIFCTATGFTSRRTTDAFYTVFLGPYDIRYSGSQNNHYKAKCYIISHKFLSFNYFTAAFKAYSAFNLFSVLIISATTIATIQSTAIRPGTNALPKLPDTISVPI